MTNVYSVLHRDGEQTESWDTWTILRFRGDECSEIAEFLDPTEAELFLSAIKWYETFLETEKLHLKKPPRATRTKPKIVKRQPVQKKRA